MIFGFKEMTQIVQQNLTLRPISAVCLLVLAVWMYHFCSLHAPTTLPPLRTAKLMARLNDQYDHVLALRRENPRKFVIRMSIACMALAVIGHVFAGIYVAMFVMAGSAILFIRQKWFPASANDQVDGCAGSKAKPIEPVQVAAKPIQPSEDMDDEFMPEPSDANDILLRRAAGDEASMSTVNDSTTCDADSDNSETDNTFDLMPDDSVPGVNENSDTSSGDECDMVAGHEIPPKMVTRSATSATTGGLRFRKDHFKNGSSPDYSSSSSDEDAMMSGLDFNKTLYASITDPSTSALDAIQNVAGQAMQKVVTAMVHKHMQYNENDKNGSYLSDSSNDSEFEIINYE